MSEIAPRKVRGAIVSGYQFCVTIGLLLASCVTYATQNRQDTGSYRIPIGIQMLWALILAIGLFLLPESPRYYVKKGNLGAASNALSRVRGQPEDSAYIQEELAEIVANHEYETELSPQGSYFSSWAACFSGGLRNPGSNLRRVILGTSLQMMQQVRIVDSLKRQIELTICSGRVSTSSSTSVPPSSKLSAQSATLSSSVSSPLLSTSAPPLSLSTPLRSTDVVLSSSGVLVSYLP
jgi:MFS family permease